MCDYKNGTSIIHPCYPCIKNEGKKEVTVDSPIINNCPSIALLVFDRYLCLWHDIIIDVVIIIIISITGYSHLARA